MRSSQSRVAKMEAGDPTVSIDLLMRSLLALGASKQELAKIISPSPRSSANKILLAETGILPPDLFEDAVVYAVAEACGCDAIVTHCCPVNDCLHIRKLLNTNPVRIPSYLSDMKYEDCVPSPSGRGS